MYVLMDMEWYQTWKSNVPVQFAALRINSNWTVMDRYKRIVHPNTTGKIKWNSVCFTGATKQEYSSAADLLTVLNDLRDWLKNDDMIFWWHESSENLFREIYTQAFGSPIGEMGALPAELMAHTAPYGT